MKYLNKINIEKFTIVYNLLNFLIKNEKISENEIVELCNINEEILENLLNEDKENEALNRQFFIKEILKLYQNPKLKGKIYCEEYQEKYDILEILESYNLKLSNENLKNFLENNFLFILNQGKINRNEDLINFYFENLIEYKPKDLKENYLSSFKSLLSYLSGDLISSENYTNLLKKLHNKLLTHFEISNSELEKIYINIIKK